MIKNYISSKIEDLQMAYRKSNHECLCSRKNTKPFNMG